MILTLTGASGAGKTTIAKELLKILPIDARMVPSYTIRKFRKPRPTDIPGEYKYISKFWFWLLKTVGAFLWMVYPHGNSYGTTKRWVIRALKDDNTVYIMILTSNAVKKLNNFAEKNGYSDRIFSFYILSPPQEVLKERLRFRGDDKDEIQKRLTDCLKWDRDALNSGIPYEFVINDHEIGQVVAEIKNRFLVKLNNCNSCF